MIGKTRDCFCAAHPSRQTKYADAAMQQTMIPTQNRSAIRLTRFNCAWSMVLLFRQTYCNSPSELSDFHYHFAPWFQDSVGFESCIRFQTISVDDPIGRSNSDRTVGPNSIGVF